MAARSIVALIDHLRKDDRLGMVVFDHAAYLAKPLGLLGDVDVGRLKQHILALSPGGGTNMESGLREVAGRR